MLGIALKRSENVNLHQGLMDFLVSNYTAEEVKRLEPAVGNVHNLRMRLVAMFERGDMEYASNINSALQYLGTVTTLSNRLPFGDHKQRTSFMGIRISKVPTVRIEWPWYDSFRRTKKVSEHEVALEKSSMLFNIGALYALDALKDKRPQNEEGLKNACTKFQTAAGVFAFIRANDELMRPASLDLSADSVGMLTNLFLAQAQACLFEKATSDKSPNLVAKLAAGASQLFYSGYLESEKPSMKQWLEKCQYPYGRHLNYQYLCFLAAAHFWQAKHCLAADEYGNEIAHLQRVRYLLQEASKLEGTLVSTLAEARESLSSKANARLAVASKDNDSIYYASVPRSDMVPVDPLVAVKATPFKIPTELAAADMALNTLVPLQVQETATEFRKRVNAFISQLHKSCDQSSNMAKSRLTELNLPAALDAMDPNAGLPEDIAKKIRSVQSKGGLGALKDLLTQVQASNKEAASVFKTIKETLEKEAKNDGEMRTQFGARWTRKPSAQITANYQNDLDSCQRFLKDASASDTKIETELSSHETNIEKLARPIEEIEQSLPKQAGPSDNTSSMQLKALLAELSQLLLKRTQQDQDVCKKATGFDIVPVLLEKSKTNSAEQIMNEEMARFELLQKSLTDLDVQQIELLDKISSANDQFVHTRKQNDVTAARERLLQELHVGIDAFNKLFGNLTEGLKFYTDLNSDFLQPLRKNVTDFVAARDMEARMMLSQLTEDIASRQPPKPVGASPEPNAGGFSPVPVSGPFPHTPVSGPMVMPAMNPSPAPAFPMYQYPAAVPPQAQLQPFPQPYSQYPPQPYAPAMQPKATPAQSRPAAQPPAPATGQKWLCSTCTYQNEAQHLCCAMCGKIKPNNA